MAHAEKLESNHDEKRPFNINTQKIQKKGEEVVDGLEDKIQTFASSAVSKAQEVAEGARDQFKKVVDNVPDTIKKYPVQSLLVGLGVGILASMVITRVAKRA